MKYFSIQELITEKMSGEWGTDPISDNCVNVLRTTNFTNEGKLKLDNVVKREIEEKKIAKKKLRYGDIIIEKSGGSPSQPVGRVVFFDIQDGEAYLCNNFTSILRPSEKVYSKYLFYNLFYLHLIGQTLNYQNKTTGIINLQLDRFLKTEKISLPPIEDQRRIIKILDEADSLRQKRKQAIGLLEDYLKSVFLEMFGDPFAKNPKFKIVRLQDVVIDEKNSIVDGPFGSSLNNNDYFDTGIPIIRINNVRDSGFYDADFKYISEKKYNELIRSKVEFNDILIPRVGNSIGKLCLFNQKYKALLSTTGVAKASIDIKIINLNFVLQQMRLPHYSKYIWNQAEGGGQPYLNLKKIKNFIILLPPMELQNKFSEIVQKVESIKQSMLFQSAELETQFQALMQKAFRGES